MYPPEANGLGPSEDTVLPFERSLFLPGSVRVNILRMRLYAGPPTFLLMASRPLRGHSFHPLTLNRLVLGIYGTFRSSRDANYVQMSTPHSVCRLAYRCPPKAPQRYVHRQTLRAPASNSISGVDK
jgi:hypothetical protein